MRIKEEIKRSGCFWLPSAPRDRVLGTLSISDGGIIELEVVRSVTVSNDDVKQVIGEGYAKRIVGEIEQDGLVTLDNCYCEGRTYSYGIKKSLIRVNRAFTGVNYDEDDIPRFNSLTFSIEGIDEWVGISGFKEGFQFQRDIVTVSYQQPPDISLKLKNGMQLLMMVRCMTEEEFFECRISQKTYFQLVSETEHELKEFTSVAHKITNFLCFAIDQTVSLDSMSATSDNFRQDIGRGESRPTLINIYSSSGLYSQNQPKIYQDDMLFRFEWIYKDAERKINNWLKAYEQINPAFNLYFLAKMGAQPSWEARFLALAQGLEVYHRRTSTEKRMDEGEFEKLVKNLIDQCPEKYRKWLGDKLNYGNEVSLSNRIKRMIEPFKDIIGTSKKRRELINNIVITRNYLTHYDLSLELKAAKGGDLLLLCLKMEVLFQLQFLQLIGFSREQIDSIVANCPQIQRKIQ